MKKTYSFLGGRLLPTQRDASEFIFNFSIIDSNLIGKPEEKSSTQHVTIHASITGTLQTMWSNRDPSFDVQKVLFEFSKRHISEKLKEGTLLPKEELWLSTETQPVSSPFESKKIQMKTGESFNVEISGSPIMGNLTYMQLATSIIETRDYINGVSKEKLGGQLLFLHSERDLLQLFREAKSEEDFVYRISALKNMATSLNEALLQSKIKNTKTITGSINLLEGYLKSLPNYDETPVKVLRSINRLRQAYPIHSDVANGVQEAHRFFRLVYPMQDFDEAWRVILMSYSDALKRILEILIAISKT